MVKSFKSLLATHRPPYIVWRNPAMSLGTRRVHFRDATLRGRTYEVLERIDRNRWSVVTVLTVLDSEQRAA
jgi:hypothetical protein